MYYKPEKKRGVLMKCFIYLQNTQRIYKPEIMSAIFCNLYSTDELEERY
jgi:hypothetical protein